MNRDRIEGASTQLKGRAQQAWGRLTGDRALEGRGRVVAFAGAAQSDLGRAMAATRSLLGFRRRLGL